MDRHTRWRVLTVVLATLALVAVTAPAAANPEQERIAETRAQLQAVRDELDNARNDADTDQIALEDADRQLRAVFDTVEAASAAVDRQQQAVTSAQDRVATAEAELERQQVLMGERVARLYRQGRQDAVISVLGAGTAADVVQQTAYINAIGREDRIQVETLTNAERRVDAEQRVLAAEQVAMEEVLVEQEALLADVEEIRNDRALIAAASVELVAELQARESYLEEEEAQLEREARARAEAERQAQIAAAQAQAARATNSSTLAASGGVADAPVAAAPAAAPDALEAQDSPDVASETGAVADSPDAAEDPGALESEPEPEPEPVAAPSGGFAWPASGTVTSEFGNRWGRLHAGIDIAGGTGTAIAAARGGTVVDIKSGGGYGNLVIISHGDGFSTYYAHLSSVAVSVGQSVSTGSYLGGMGCTGSCTGTHLHFEIRSGGSPVNPRNYL